MNRGAAQEASLDHPFAVISIVDPGNPVAFAPAHHRQATLTIECHDVHEPSTVYTAFNNEHARSIRNFVDRLPVTTKTVIVHCNYGASRSPAVAAALSRLHGQPAGAYFALGSGMCPNTLVYRIMLEELGLSDDLHRYPYAN